MGGDLEMPKGFKKALCVRKKMLQGKSKKNARRACGVKGTVAGMRRKTARRAFETDIKRSRELGRFVSKRSS